MHGTIKKTIISLTLIATLCGCQLSPQKSKDAKHKSYSNLKSTHEVKDLPSLVNNDKAALLNLELGIKYLQQNNTTRAKVKILRALKLAPDLPEVHYTYAYYLEQVGEIENAQSELEKAVKLNPTSGRTLNNYGAFLCRRGAFKAAEEAFIKALKDRSYPNTAEIYENAGMCVLQVPNYAKAQDYFEKALRYDSTRAQTLLELGFIYYRAKDYTKAKVAYEEFAKLSEHNKRSILLGLQLAKISNDDNQRANLQKLLQAQYPNAQLTQIMQ